MRTLGLCGLLAVLGAPLLPGCKAGTISGDGSDAGAEDAYVADDDASMGGPDGGSDGGSAADAHSPEDATVDPGTIIPEDRRVAWSPGVPGGIPPVSEVCPAGAPSVTGFGAVGDGVTDDAQAFADAIGATLSCSRPVADNEWLPKSRQVGTSGKTVKPKIYIALGISGAFQHQVGMKQAQTIIAVNTDPAAPIFGVAHYGIVGNLMEVVPKLTDLFNS